MLQDVWKHVLHALVNRTGLFTADTASITLSITKPVFKADVYTPEESIYAEYAKFLEAGSLPITLKSHAVSAEDYRSRALMCGFNLQKSRKR